MKIRLVEPSFSMWAGGRMDRLDKAKSRFFCNFANTPESKHGFVPGVLFKHREQLCIYFAGCVWVLLIVGFNSSYV